MSHATLPQAGTHERPHPTVQLYVAIAVFLAIITSIEVAIYYVPDFHPGFYNNKGLNRNGPAEFRRLIDHGTWVNARSKTDRRRCKLTNHLFKRFRRRLNADLIDRRPLSIIERNKSSRRPGRP